MAKNPTARRSDWITATPTTPSATPRIVAAVKRNQMGPLRLAAGKTPQQTPSEIGGAPAVGDDDGGNRERENER